MRPRLPIAAALLVVAAAAPARAQLSVEGRFGGAHDAITSGDVDPEGRLAVDLDLGYTFTDHRSNDAFYDYVSHAFGLSFSAAY
jgi:hypothetical protein